MPPKKSADLGDVVEAVRKGTEPAARLMGVLAAGLDRIGLAKGGTIKPKRASSSSRGRRVKVRPRRR